MTGWRGGSALNRTVCVCVSVCLYLCFVFADDRVQGLTNVQPLNYMLSSAFLFLIRAGQTTLLFDELNIKVNRNLNYACEAPTQPQIT